VTTSAQRAVEPSLDPPYRARRSIVAPGVRSFALAVLVVAAGLLAAASFAFHGVHHGTALDDSLARHLSHVLGAKLTAATLHASDPRLTVGLLVVVGLGALVARRWDLAVFTALSPILAIVLTEDVLKPVVGRYLTYTWAGIAPPRGGAFPSGHETGLASLTVELAVLVLRAPIAAGWRALVVAVLAAWTAIGAVGLTANLYHYGTDTMGGVLVAIVTVLGVALVVDAVAGRLSSPAARSRPSTSPAA
jgi:undecaprenyl-diphosphatase